MYTKLLLVALLAMPLLVNCIPTHCCLGKGSSEFRCGKDNYRADSIRIRNIANRNVSFGISKWMSRCGQGGAEYEVGQRYLGPGASHNEFFSEAGVGRCNGLFINNCRLDGQRLNCVFVVTPSVN